LAIQPIKPARTNVPSPPTMFLNSTILSHVCESIFQELNNLIEAKNNPIHEDSYEKLWLRLKDKVVGTKGVSQVYHLSFDDNKVLKIINWIC